MKIGAVILLCCLMAAPLFSQTATVNWAGTGGVDRTASIPTTLTVHNASSVNRLYQVYFKNLHDPYSMSGAPVDFSGVTVSSPVVPPGGSFVYNFSRSIVVFSGSGLLDSAASFSVLLVGWNYSGNGNFAVLHSARGAVRVTADRSSPFTSPVVSGSLWNLNLTDGGNATSRVLVVAEGPVDVKRGVEVLASGSGSFTLDAYPGDVLSVGGDTFTVGSAPIWNVSAPSGGEEHDFTEAVSSVNLLTYVSFASFSVLAVALAFNHLF